MIKSKNKGGRPKIKIDWDLVDKFLFIQATGEEIAGALDIGYKTLQRKCIEEKKMGFDQYSELKRGHGKISLRRNQWNLAKKNPAMAIFLGKQFLGQSDKQEQKIETTLNGQDEFKWKLEVTHVNKNEKTDDQ